MNNPIPDGYMENAKGDLTRKELVKPIDLTRDQLVNDLIREAEELHAKMAAFKQKALSEIQNFVELSAMEYGSNLGGEKGNVSLLSFNGKLKIQRSVAEHINFDERLLVAKSLIDQCINRWSEDANSNVQKLVEHAFRTNQQGHVSAANILGLRRLDIDDPDWKKAMTAISDAILVVDSKVYLRFYERIENTENFQSISLQMSEV